MRLFLLITLAVCAAAQRAPSAEPEDSVYVYDVFRGTPGCGELLDRLRALPLRPTVILSIEQGPEFVLDRPNGAEQLACVVRQLRASSRKVKALFLQDPAFLERGEEAVRRAALLRAFASRHPRQLSGVQVDLEPYASEKWSCCGVEERRAQMRNLHQLLLRVRRELRRLPLGLAAAWWYPALREVPEAWPKALFGVADEIYLMVYGDEGGPLVGGTADRVLERLTAPELFAGRGRIHIALATYEFASPPQFQAELQTLRWRLAWWRNFAGTAIFHAASAFNVPLLHLVSGTVTDQDGRSLSGVEIEAAGIRGHSDQCGQFSLRGLPAPQAELLLSKPGFRTQKLSIELAPPGAVRELGNIVLERDEGP